MDWSYFLLVSISLISFVWKMKKMGPFCSFHYFFVSWTVNVRGEWNCSFFSSFLFFSLVFVFSRVRWQERWRPSPFDRRRRRPGRRRVGGQKHWWVKCLFFSTRAGVSLFLVGSLILSFVSCFVFFEATRDGVPLCLFFFVRRSFSLSPLFSRFWSLLLNRMTGP